MSKIKVAAVIDCKNWSWDIKVDNLSKFIDKKYQIDKFYTRDDPAPNIELFNNDYDLILAYAWGQGTEDRGLYTHWKEVKTPKVLCKCSHFMARQASILIAPQFDAVIANNPELVDIFANRCKTYYCPNGVDTEMFKPDNYERDDFMVGSVGASGTRHEKGFYDFIKPNVADNELMIIDRNEKWWDFSLMPNYYKSIGVYACMSKFEGTPNPALEAAACGVPLISTRVGNMPELIKDGENGFLIDHSGDELKEKLSLYRASEELREQHGRQIRKDIEADWGWEKQVKNFENAFTEILEETG